LAFLILIVDDSRIARKILRRALPDGDFEIREAADGQECLDICEQEMPDLVFLDLTMPGINGFETIERLKRINPDVKVVVVSADVQRQSKAVSAELGAAAFLSKPLDDDEVRAIVEKMLP
jgi:two-component system chemotaxis response regulator CheY